MDKEINKMTFRDEIAKEIEAIETKKETLNQGLIICLIISLRKMTE